MNITEAQFKHIKLKLFYFKFQFCLIPRRNTVERSFRGVRNTTRGGDKCPPWKLFVKDALLDLKNAFKWAKNKIFARFAPPGNQKCPPLAEILRTPLLVKK